MQTVSEFFDLLRSKEICLAQGDGGTYGIFKLTDIPGPFIGAHFLQKCLCDPLNRPWPRIPVTVNKKVDEGWNIFPAFAQRRDMYFCNTKPVKEFLSKGTFSHHCRQVPVGCGNYAHIHLHLSSTT